MTGYPSLFPERVLGREESDKAIVVLRGPWGVTAGNSHHPFE